MSNTTLQNEPFISQENDHSDQLDHIINGHGKWISSKVLENLAVNGYRTNGRGLTYSYLSNKLGISKKKAQRKLKNATKSGLLFTLDNRTKPQQYFPSSIKAEIIKNKIDLQKNRLIATTGVTSNIHAFSSRNPLDNALIYKMIYSLLSSLIMFPFQLLFLHNIHLWTEIDKSHYQELFQNLLNENQAKTYRERIGVRQVIYKFNKSGSIQIDIESSRAPFKIETDDDVNSFFVFIGQVKDRLAAILNDPRERIVPDINDWVLKACDFNKDIEYVGDIGQILDPNIQIKYAGKAFRLYVKNMEAKFVIRGEQTMKIDKPVFPFFNHDILHPYHLIQTKIEEIVDRKFQELLDKIKDLHKTDN